MKTIKKQVGFTLVEIAIVLVIVGLLLAGVLKGQELIESGRVKRAATDIEGLEAAYTTYLDRYKALPGDDGPTATFTARGGTWATLPAAAVGNLNGTIAGAAGDTFIAAGPNSENELFFSHLRAANLLTGNPLATLAAALPNNPWGGKIGLVNVTGIQGRPAAKLLVCLGSVPGKAAAALDRQLDDGSSATGTLRATLGAANTAPTAAAAATSYAEDQVYTVCRDFP